jgi:hypothetical protein
VRYTHVITLASTLILMTGCDAENSDKNTATISGAVGVANRSQQDIFPILQGGREEDFGIVSADGLKVSGFTSVDVGAALRIVWAEGEWNSATKTVVFPTRIAADIVARTKHLQFTYTGKDEWKLELCASSPPNPEDVLATIPGNVE